MNREGMNFLRKLLAERCCFSPPCFREGPGVGELRKVFLFGMVRFEIVESEDNKRTVCFFKGFCYRCISRIEFPLLGDFAYGEDIFQTIDGKKFYIAELLKNKVVLDEIKAVLKDEKYDLRKIEILVADQPGGNPFSTDILCPKCARSLWVMPLDNVKTSERSLNNVTWTSYLSKTKEEREQIIKEAYVKTKTKLFPFKQKLLVFLFPFPIPIHTYFASKKFEKGGKRLQKEYNNWMQRGFIFYFLLLMLWLYQLRN
jgi:hypothetical protein